jgi:hypothetical protein
MPSCRDPTGTAPGEATRASDVRHGLLAEPVYPLWGSHGCPCSASFSHEGLSCLTALEGQLGVGAQQGCCVVLRWCAVFCGFAPVPGVGARQGRPPAPCLPTAGWVRGECALGVGLAPLGSGGPPRSWMSPSWTGLPPRAVWPPVGGLCPGSGWVRLRAVLRRCAGDGECRYRFLGAVPCSADEPQATWVDYRSLGAVPFFRRWGGCWSPCSAHWSETNRELGCWLRLCAGGVRYRSLGAVPLFFCRPRRCAAGAGMALPVLGSGASFVRRNALAWVEPPGGGGLLWGLLRGWGPLPVLGGGATLLLRLAQAGGRYRS